MSKDVDFANLAEKYQLAGGSIINVLRYCVLMATEQKWDVQPQDILKGIQRELAKEGKTL